VDPIQPVGGAEGLSKLAGVVCAEAAPVDGIYLINRQSDGGADDWVVVLVKSAGARDGFVRLAPLRNQGYFFQFKGIRIDPVKPDDKEVVRIINYARRFDRLPVEGEGVPLDRTYIRYALVAELPRAGAVAE
jgi:hypothetical protein